MKRKNVTLITLSLAFSLLITSNLLAGTGAGNGDYCEQKGADCSRTSFNISGKHPQHDKLVEMIKAAELPRILKHEMLRDLDETQVVYSGEVIRYKDLRTRYEMQLNELTRKTVYDRYGNVVKHEEIEKWERVAILPKLGIYLNHEHTGYQAGDEDKLFVRAVTQINPRKVIYFTNFVSKMSVADQMKLVLHEQGHRLKFLDAFNQDERVVEGWAHELLQYLNGKITKERFYQTMAAYKLNINGRYNFGQRKRAGATVSYVDVPLLLNKDNIVSTNTDASHTNYIGIAKNAFDSYPGLNTKDQLLSVYGLSKDGLERVDYYFDPVVDGKAEVNLNLRVYFTTESQERDGVRSSSDNVLMIEPSTAHVEKMYVDVQTELNKFFTQIPPTEIALVKYKRYADFTSYDYYKPNLQLYARPDILLNSDFEKYNQNAVRTAQILSSELLRMESIGDTFAAFLKSKFNHTYFSYTTYSNGPTDIKWIKSLSKNEDDDQYQNLHSVTVGFTLNPKVNLITNKLLNQGSFRDLTVEWSQIEIYVSSQMTDSQILDIVRSAIEEARVRYNQTKPSKK